MLRLSVKPEAADDLTSLISLFPVGENIAWTGHGNNHLFKPYSQTNFNAEGDLDAIFTRMAFTTERSIIGRNLIFPESRLGQLAIILSSKDKMDTISAAIAIPVKNRRLGRLSEVIHYAPLTSDDSKPEGIINMHLIVRDAIFEVINTEPAQLTRLGE